MALSNIIITISASYQQATAAFNALENQVKSIAYRTGAFDATLRNVDRTLKYIAAGSALAVTYQFGKMAAELQLLELRIGTFNRDLSTIPVVMDQLVAISREAPFSIKSLSDAFVKLKAAGLDPLVDKYSGKNLIQSLSDSVAAFGGNTDVFERAILAISQMAGKGTISMEELRQQLGEAIPIALRAMAQGLNMSVSELITAVSKGQIEAKRGIDAMVSILVESTGGAGALLKNTMTGALQTIRTEFERLLLILSRAGVFDVITAALQKVAVWFGNIVNYVKDFTESSSRMDEVGRRVEAIGIYAAQAIRPIQALFEIIGQFVSAATSGGELLPAEMVGGGLLGFVLFGRAGIIAGALASLVADELVNIATIIASGFEGLIAIVKDMGVEHIAVGGLLGYLIFGKAGLLAVFALGVIDMVVTAVRDAVYAIDRWARGVIGGISEAAKAMLSGDFNVSEAWTRGSEKARAQLEEFIKTQNKAKDFFRYGDLNKTVLADMIDTLAGEKGDKAKTTVKDLSKGIQDLVDGMKQQRQSITNSLKAIQEFGGLDEKTVQNFEKMSKMFDTLRYKVAGQGDEKAAAIAKYKDQIVQLDTIISSVSARIAGMSDTDSRRAGLEKELGNLTKSRQEWTKLIEQYEQIGSSAGAAAERGLLRVTNQLADMNRQLDIIQNQTIGDFDPIKKAADETKDKFDDLRAKLEQYAAAMQGAKISGAAKQVVMAGIAATQDRLNEIEKRAIELAKEKARWQIEDAVRMAQQAVRQEQINLLTLQMANAFDEAGLAIEQARYQVEQSLEGINQKIREIERNMRSKGGLIPDDVAAKMIEQLRNIYAQMETEGTKYIERVKFETSLWGKMWIDIASTIESSFGDAIFGIVTGTRTAQEVLTQFYSAITKAVLNYLVKQAMVGIFGQGMGGAGGFGQMLGSIFTPFGPGGMVGFASGGSFLVAGNGGTDSVPVNFMASPGERVTVETPGQARRNGSGGVYNINISAVDARSVRELFMREGSSLIGAITHRSRLGRGQEIT